MFTATTMAAGLGVPVVAVKAGADVESNGGAHVVALGFRGQH